MDFVNLNRKLRTTRPNHYHKNRELKKRWVKLPLFLLILIVGILLSVIGVYQSAEKMIAAARNVNNAVKQGNLDDIGKNLREIKEANDDLNTSLNFLVWVRLIPYFGGFYTDMVHFSKAVGYELNAAIQISDFLNPYKSELGFTGQPTAGQDRVAQVVKILNKTIPNLDQIEPQLKKASDEVESIDVSKYPEKFGSKNIKSQVDIAKNLITGAYFAVSQARPAIEVAPGALGDPTPRNYLIIFQNDKELRPTGGFMTAYAFLKLDKGHISSSTSDDIYRLDEKLLNVCKSKICPLTPPAPLVKYLPEANGKPRTTWSMRDSNISPDLPTSMGNFERMYTLLGEGTPFDGIITIDTHVVEELIKITGAVEVFGTKYSAETDKRCNCPNVVFELENYAQIIEKGEQDRKAILGTLMQQILARLLGTPTEKIPEFINAGVKLVQSKHVMFYMHDTKTQDALSELNWTGKIRQADGDYLHINDSNFAGGKSNLYVEEEVSLDIDTKNGRHKLKIDYKNPQKYDSWLNQRNRDYVRIYVPKGSKIVSSKGSDVAVTTIEDELGKTVFEAFIEVRPQNSRQLVFEYDTPEVDGKDGKYPLLIQKQPGTKYHKYDVKINGSKKAEFKLDMDKKLKLSI